MQTGCVYMCFFVYGQCVCFKKKKKKAAPDTSFQESLILLPGSVGELCFAKCYLWIQVPKNIIKKVFSNDVCSLRTVVSSIVTIQHFYKVVFYHHSLKIFL